MNLLGFLRFLVFFRFDEDDDALIIVLSSASTSRGDGGSGCGFSVLVGWGFHEERTTSNAHQTADERLHSHVSKI